MHKRVDVEESDLAYKYQPMRDSIFAVLRGTFYRWASRWEETSPDFAKAPRVMAVGDLHEFWKKPDWLRTAALVMTKATEQDWQAYRSAGGWA